MKSSVRQSVAFVVAIACLFGLAAPVSAAESGAVGVFARGTPGPPRGVSTWIRAAPEFDTWNMVRVWRKGKRVRVYVDDGGYPGDGKFCFRGRLKGSVLRGWELGPAPDPYRQSYRVRRVGDKLVFKGVYAVDATMDRRRWRPASVATYRSLVPEAGSGRWCRTYGL